MYARSGKLLKILTIGETKKIGKIYYPTKIKMEDKVRNDSFTEIFITDIKLDIKISDSIFTLRNLEKRKIIATYKVNINYEKLTDSLYACFYFGFL
jgi:hypothetical protein